VALSAVCLVFIGRTLFETSAAHGRLRGLSVCVCRQWRVGGCGQCWGAEKLEASLTKVVYAQGKMLDAKRSEGSARFVSRFTLWMILNSLELQCYQFVQWHML
jgi:hypothetical protein